MPDRVHKPAWFGSNELSPPLTLPSVSLQLGSLRPQITFEPRVQLRLPACETRATPNSTPRLIDNFVIEDRVVREQQRIATVSRRDERRSDHELIANHPRCDNEQRPHDDSPTKTTQRGPAG